jgi:hypothetical protein
MIAADRPGLSRQCRLLSISRPPFYYPPTITPQGRENGESGADPPHRRFVSQISLLRQPANGAPVAPGKYLCRASPGSPFDPPHRARRHLSGAGNQHAAPAAPDLSLSAREPDGRAPRSCLVRRHPLHPRAARVPLPDRDHGLGGAPCPGVVVKHHCQTPLSNTIDALFCVAAVGEAMAGYGKPEICNCKIRT